MSDPAASIDDLSMQAFFRRCKRGETPGFPHFKSADRWKQLAFEAPGRSFAAKAGLNRVVLDAGFGLLEQMILAKAEEAGRRVVRVNPRFSSQECSHCGHVACGARHHADVNAALVIRGRAQSVLMSELIPAEDAGSRNHDVAA